MLTMPGNLTEALLAANRAAAVGAIRQAGLAVTLDTDL